MADATNNTIDYHSHPELMLETDRCFLVSEGFVDVFARVLEGEFKGNLYPIARFEKGEVFFSFQHQSKVEVIAKLSFEASLVERTGDFNKERLSPDGVQDVVSWLSNISHFYRDVVKPYRAQSVTAESTAINLNENHYLYSKAMRWLVLADEVRVKGMVLDKSLQGTIFFPVGRVFLAESDGKATIETTESILDKKGLSFIKAFWSDLLDSIDDRFQIQKINKKNHYKKQLEVEELAKVELNNNINQALFFRDLDKASSDQFDVTDIYAALSEISKHLRIKIARFKPNDVFFDTRSEELEELASHLDLHVNKITLSPGWWKKGSTPYVCFSKEGEAYALLPTLMGRYVLKDCRTGQKRLLTEELAASLIETVYLVSPKLSDQTISFSKLFSYAFLGNKFNFILLLLAFFMVALLGLANPVVTGYITNDAIVNANLGLVFQLTLTLLGVGITIGLFTIVRNIVLVRFETMMNYNMQCALMSRVLKLPLEFFSDYSIGDVTNRILAVDAMVKTFSGNNVNGMLTFVFSLVSFVLMFYYAWVLALIVLAVVLLMLAIFYGFTVFQLPYMQKSMNQMGDTFGLMYQVINGITRVKLFARETFAESSWGGIYSEYRRDLLKGYLLGAWRSTFFSIAQLFTMILLFIVVAWWYSKGIEFQNFITFFSAFTQFMAGMLMFSSTATAIVPAIVFYRRLKPLLDAPLETSQESGDGAFQLVGAIKAEQLAFSYGKDAPMVLSEISFDIRPGEYVAIVGFSGSGKSTLFKLLLGFYFANKGSLAIDGQSIRNIDVKALRKQMGVVLQDGKLVSGTILENIIGNSNLSEDDAWTAASLIGLDKFIAKLPMGMQTVVSQSMSSFSGGQKQLILIARALVRKPKLLLLDEATSALDNKSQALVTESINQLQMTRIAIAHRLSTIQKADRILVLENGKISESGTFEELLAQKGFFYQLAKDQMLHTPKSKDNA